MFLSELNIKEIFLDSSLEGSAEEEIQEKLFKQIGYNQLVCAEAFS